jgi:hypothetical protein
MIQSRWLAVSLHDEGQEDDG